MKTKTKLTLMSILILCMPFVFAFAGYYISILELRIASYVVLSMLSIIFILNWVLMFANYGIMLIKDEKRN